MRGDCHERGVEPQPLRVHAVHCGEPRSHKHAPVRELVSGGPGWQVGGEPLQLPTPGCAHAGIATWEALFSIIEGPAGRGYRRRQLHEVTAAVSVQTQESLKIVSQ